MHIIPDVGIQIRHMMHIPKDYTQYHVTKNIPVSGGIPNIMSVLQTQTPGGALTATWENVVGIVSIF
jgi:hypothetical protein